MNVFISQCVQINGDTISRPNEDLCIEPRKNNMHFINQMCNKLIINKKGAPLEPLFAFMRIYYLIENKLYATRKPKADIEPPLFA